MLNVTHADDGMHMLRDGEADLRLMDRADAIQLRDALSRSLASEPDAGYAARVSNPNGEGIIGVTVPTHYERHIAQQIGAGHAPDHLPAMDPETLMREQDAAAAEERRVALEKAHEAEREKAEGVTHEAGPGVEGQKEGFAAVAPPLPEHNGE